MMSVWRLSVCRVHRRAYSKENFGLHRWRHLWRARSASL